MAWRPSASLRDALPDRSISMRWVVPAGLARVEAVGGDTSIVEIHPDDRACREHVVTGTAAAALSPVR
ncbi:hypothetical protein [Mycobacterium stomatepiae]|uniref:hypothetical protein n=1 Tax=Mycobacterium stomatepiae TaxID=470076 RepID=UPI0013D1E111|nr:hypothetical protein [Mycobacterium stomatepiae]MCV7163068.1 hypothetical protein [Mycobacterium stomatepiae]